MMTMTAIHCHIACDRNTTGYVHFAWTTMLSLANHPDLMRLTVHCMGSTTTTKFGELKQATTKQVNGDDQFNGSFAHAACITDALAMANDDDIHIICDSDAIIAAKGWDDHVRMRMLNAGVGMMGTTYEDIGGASSGVSKTQTYKKVPTFTWVALNPRCDWSRLNVAPHKDKQIAITDERMSRIYNLPIGYSVYGEAGYMVPEYLANNHITYEGWPQLKASKGATVLVGTGDYHEEYHSDNVPFVLHQRGSLRHAYRNCRLSNGFFNAVDKYLVDELGREPRWTFDANADENIPPPTSTLEPPIPDVVPVAEQEPRIEITGDEWLKVTFNGTAAIKLRSGIDRNVSTTITFAKPAASQVCQLRVEGALKSPYGITIPGTTGEFYITALRNATQVPITVTTGERYVVTVPSSKTWWLMVDVDGVQHIE